MDIFAWGFIFLATGIVLTIFILGVPLFLRAPKNQPTFIRIVGVVLSFGVFASASILLISHTYYSDLGSVVPIFKSVLSVIAPLILTCIFLQALFIRSIRKSLIDHKALINFLSAAALLAISGFGLMQYLDSIDTGIVNSQFVERVLRSLGFACIMLWIIFELREAQKKEKSFIFQVMQILSSIIFLQTLGWLIFLVIDYYGTNHSLSTKLGGPQVLELNVRMIRGGIFCTFEVLLSIYWVQHYSLSAYVERQKQEKIQELLLEKDVLIKNLSNSSTLIESGALSAGLAHELNQFLGRIALNRDEMVQLISQPGMKSEDLKLPLDNILKANHAAANLISSLRKLFSRGDEQPSLCSVDELVKDIVFLYQERIQKSHIEIVLDLRVLERQIIWETLFRQVIVNLLSNAIDALDASSQTHKVIQIQSSTNQQGDYCLIITDNGPGIHAQQGAKIFNLFASSKTTGTGVGLWLSRYIVERHKGTLTYQNLPTDSGVSFIVTIPSDSNRNNA